jgi:hypothetical protein
MAQNSSVLDVLDVLAAGIPISLLLDLALPGGPDSPAIWRWEQRQANPFS